MLNSPISDIYSVYINMTGNSISLPISIASKNKTVETLALVDSGAG